MTIVRYPLPEMEANAFRSLSVGWEKIRVLANMPDQSHQADGKVVRVDGIAFEAPKFLHVIGARWRDVGTKYAEATRLTIMAVCREDRKSLEKYHMEAYLDIQQVFGGGDSLMAWTRCEATSVTILNSVAPTEGLCFGERVFESRVFSPTGLLLTSGGRSLLVTTSDVVGVLNVSASASVIDQALEDVELTLL